MPADPRAEPSAAPSSANRRRALATDRRDPCGQGHPGPPCACCDARPPRVASVRAAGAVALQDSDQACASCPQPPLSRSMLLPHSGRVKCYTRAVFPGVAVRRGAGPADVAASPAARHGKDEPPQAESAVRDAPLLGYTATTGPRRDSGDPATATSNRSARRSCRRSGSKAERITPQIATFQTRMVRLRHRPPSIPPGYGVPPDLYADARGIASRRYRFSSTWIRTPGPRIHRSGALEAGTRWSDQRRRPARSRDPLCS